jgi:NifB/MoaA-like Fe-S oxidoreductase
MLARLRELRGEVFKGRGLICTGTLAAPFLNEILMDSRYRILPVKNRYLGGGTGVAGLLAGRDVAAAVNGFPESYNRVILPAVMFNYRGVTIDDMTGRDIEDSISAEVIVLENLKELVE